MNALATALAADEPTVAFRCPGCGVDGRVQRERDAYAHVTCPRCGWSGHGPRPQRSRQARPRWRTGWWAVVKAIEKARRGTTPLGEQNARRAG